MLPHLLISITQLYLTSGQDHVIPIEWHPKVIQQVMPVLQFGFSTNHYWIQDLCRVPEALGKEHTAKN